MSARAQAVRPLGRHEPDPDAAPRRLVAGMVAVMLAFLVCAGIWAALAELDVSVQARGTVVPPSRLQEVQSLEGGIVEEMLVSPGERVTTGQVLARLDTAQVQADVGESRQQQLAALAGLARVDALLAGTEPRFDPTLQAEAPELVAKERQLWRDGIGEYRASQNGAREGVQRRRGELAEAEARIQLLSASVRLAEESFALEERLVREGAGARADLLNAQQRLLTQRTELESLRQSLPRLRAGLAEGQAQAAEMDAKFRSQWGAQRSEFATKAATLDSQLMGRRDRAARREVVSPIDGTVNRVLVTTRGGVAQPGKPILEIVPDEARLQMTVRVKPQDVGFLRPGQPAHVRVLPYDASTYGQMDAVVERVGADAVLDERADRAEPYFEVQLTAERGQLTLHGKPLPLNPGMPVDVAVLTGQRTVLQYLMKPVLRGIQGALQER